ncbi:MAG: phosphatase PAP2 family protein [Rhodothermales bacterium]
MKLLYAAAATPQFALWKALTVGVLICLTTVPAYGQQNDHELGRKRFARWIYQDAGSAFQRKYPYAPVYVAGGLTAFGVLNFVDRWAADELPEGYKGFLRDYADVTNNFGGPLANIPVVGIFAISLATPYERFQDAAFTSMETVLYAGAINYSLKFFFGRVRPEDTDNPLIFVLFSGNSSFPSGHANAAFSILTPWVMYYPHPVTYALLVVGAGGTAIARISRQKHWFSDVFIGSALGFATGRWLSMRHQRMTGDRPGGLDLSIHPVGGIDQRGIGLTLTF